MSNAATTPDSGATTATIITLIRHGESEVTVDRVIGGVRTCRGLSPLGRQQAEALRDRLITHDELHADVLISSDFPRAIETAEIIRPGFGERIGGGDIEQLADFGEHDPGPRIDGMSFEAYVEEFGTPEWSGDPDVEIFPGGETTRRFHERVGRGLVELERRFAGRHVVVACHGGVVDAVFRTLLGLAITGGFDLHTLNTAITTFERPADSPERWRLSRYNDTGHLVGLPAATERRGTRPDTSA
ncbi:MAG: histidine phosphatase family protein [Ilumatobacter sp.]